MSAHVRDRLSAYLDQELPPGERTAVETHLQVCDACRQHLETLAAVDAAARALQVEAPPGYFDALPGRVRARLEWPGARARPARFHLPAWTWAAAAALVLGVVTPLTMMSVWRDRPEQLPAPRVAELPPPTAAASPLAGAAGGKLEAKERLADDLARRQAESAPAAAKAQPAKKDSIPSTRAEQDAFAQPPLASTEEYAAAAQAPAAPAAAAPSSKALEARKRARDAGGPHEQQQVQTQAQAAGGVTADNRASALRADEPAAAEAETKVLRREPQAAPEGRALAKTSRDKDGAGLREEIVVSSDEARAESPVAEYRRLIVAPAQTLAALRARREAWRAFALSFPNSPLADEARVRVVETGAAAWRLGHDPEDLARLREDAAVYLERKDAAHAARVRAALQKVERP